MTEQNQIITFKLQKQQAPEKKKPALAIHLSDYISAARLLPKALKGTKLRMVPFGNEKNLPPHLLRASVYADDENGYLFGSAAESAVRRSMEERKRNVFSYESFANICQHTGNGQYMDAGTRIMLRKLLGFVIRRAWEENEEQPFSRICIWHPSHLSFDPLLLSSLRDECRKEVEKNNIVFCSDALIFSSYVVAERSRWVPIIAMDWGDDALRVSCRVTGKEDEAITEFPELGGLSLDGYLWDFLLSEKSEDLLRYDMRNIQDVASIRHLFNASDPLQVSLLKANQLKPSGYEERRYGIRNEDVWKYILGMLQSNVDVKAHGKALAECLVDLGAKVNRNEVPSEVTLLVNYLAKQIQSMPDARVFLTGTALNFSAIQVFLDGLFGNKLVVLDDKMLLERTVYLDAHSAIHMVGRSETPETSVSSGSRRTVPANASVRQHIEAESMALPDAKADETGRKKSMVDRAIELLASEKQEDKKLALAYLRIAANEDKDDRAIEILGLILSEGKWKKKKITDPAPEEAVAYLRVAAEYSPQAMNYLGMHYWEGSGIEKNDVSAFMWYLRSARAGYAAAKFNTANSYMNGEGVPPDMGKGLKWLQKAAKKDKFRNAQYKLGTLHEEGLYAEDKLILRPNPRKAIKWYKKAAKQGFALAQLHLGSCYKEGKGVQQSESAAMRWYNRAMKNTEFSEEDKAWGYYAMGDIMEKAAPRKKVLQSHREAKAIGYYEKSAQCGSVEAKGWLGYCYWEGVMVPQDRKKGIEYYREAAENGNSLALNNLAILYETGCNPYVSMDIEKALSYYAQAAATGESKAADNYERLQKKTYDEERENLKTLAKCGEVISQKNYAYACAGLFGEKAREWLAPELFANAAEAGHIPSLLLMAQCYMGQFGGDDDEKKSMEYIRKAIELRKIKGDATLPRCFRHSLNGVSDIQDAVAWFGGASAKQVCGLDEESLAEGVAEWLHNVDPDKLPAVDELLPFALQRCTGSELEQLCDLPGVYEMVENLNNCLHKLLSDADPQVNAFVTELMARSAEMVEKRLKDEENLRCGQEEHYRNKEAGSLLPADERSPLEAKIFSGVNPEQLRDLPGLQMWFERFNQLLEADSQLRAAVEMLMARLTEEQQEELRKQEQIVDGGED